MAQTLPVLTGGLDLSVGTILALSNCVASASVDGTPLETPAGLAITSDDMLLIADRGASEIYETDISELAAGGAPEVIKLPGEDATPAASPVGSPAASPAASPVAG